MAVRGEVYWDEPNLSHLGKLIVPALIVVLVLYVGYSSYYVVEPDEEAVVLRFGRYLSTSGPGLHFKAPFAIDEALKVVTRVQKEEFGFRTRQAGVDTVYDFSTSYDKESLMLTGDLNCVIVTWIVRYKIVDSKNYVINMRNVEETIRDVSEAVMRQIVGDMSVDEVISIERPKIALVAREELQTILDTYDCGIHIDAVKLKDAKPPVPVEPAFNAVNKARQQKEQMINEAQGTYNSKVPAAEGEKEQAIQEAEGYAVKRENEAKGDTDRFLSIYEEYKKAEDVTRRRLYLEAMAKLLPKIGKLYVLDEEQRSILPLLRLDEKGGVR